MRATRAIRAGSPRYHVGCSGWSYDGWRGAFYPDKLPQSKWLAYYASVFDVVEVDSTFYTVPRPEVVKGWHDRTPAGFKFVPKLFKGITHELHRAVSDGRLGALVDRYFDAMGELGGKLAATVIQLPPGFGAKHADDLFALLDTLPHGIRHAIEFRDRSWFGEPGVMRRIEQQGNVSVAGSIHPDVVPFLGRTADFFVFRFIGDRALQWFGAVQRDVQDQVAEIKHRMDVELQDVRDTFVFFNNHYAGFGPASVNLFRQLAGMSPARFGTGKDQKSLADFLA